MTKATYTVKGYLPQTIEDVWTLLDHLQLIEHVLDEEVDPEDGLGTEGWRHHIEAVSANWSKR